MSCRKCADDVIQSDDVHEQITKLSLPENQFWASTKTKEQTAVTQQRVQKSKTRLAWNIQKVFSGLNRTKTQSESWMVTFNTIEPRPRNKHTHQGLRFSQIIRSNLNNHWRQSVGEQTRRTWTKHKIWRPPTLLVLALRDPHFGAFLALIQRHVVPFTSRPIHCYINSNARRS